MTACENSHDEEASKISASLGNGESHHSEMVSVDEEVASEGVRTNCDQQGNAGCPETLVAVHKTAMGVHDAPKVKAR